MLTPNINSNGDISSVYDNISYADAVLDWITEGDSSTFLEGLRHGVGDYFAASYSCSKNLLYKDNEEEYHWVFPWDEHNEF